MFLNLERKSNFNYLGTVIEYNGKVDKEITEGGGGDVGTLHNTLRNMFFWKSQVGKEVVRF